MAREFQTKQRTYLRINSNGELYTSSNEAKEGYDPITLDSGKVVYHRKFMGTDFGKITRISLNEKTYERGKVLVLDIVIGSEDEASEDVIQLQLKNKNNGMADVIKKLVTILPSLDYSQNYTITSNRKESARGYVDKVLFFSRVLEDGKTELVKGSLKFGEGGDVPMFKTEPDPMDESKTLFDYREQDIYLMNVLKYELNRFDEFRKGNVFVSEYYKDLSTPTEKEPTATAAPTKTAKKAEAQVATETPSESGVVMDEDNPFGED